jgi:hypothetical protein
MRWRTGLLSLVVLTPLMGCGTPAPAPTPPAALVAPARQMEPVFEGIIQFEWLGDGEPVRKMVEIGPGKVTTDYVQIEPDEGNADVVFDFRFLHHQEGADHYRFGAYLGAAGFSGAGVVQDTAFSGQPVVVFDKPDYKYKVQILPPAAETEAGTPSANRSP